MKGVFVILDGIGDEACKDLNGKTPLEYAKTPNLDRFAFRGKIDYCFTVREGYVPESNEGVLSLMGYESSEVGRGALEALGLGVKLTNGDLALRCNFASIDDLDNKEVLDRRAGRVLRTKEARILAKAINKGVKLNGGLKFNFVPGIQHRAALVIRGGFNDNISNVESKNGKMVFSTALDDEDDSKFAADLVNQFVRKSHDILDKHKINLDRARRGLYSANVILCRGAESDKINMKKMKGNWMALGYMPLEIGIARALKMDVYRYRVPKMRNVDVYGHLYKRLDGAIKSSVKMLKKNKSKYDYFYVHLKETDLPGHDGKAEDKVKMIEMIDKELFGFLRTYIGKGKLVVTGDHVTSCKKKEHTAGAVPVLSCPFDEKERKQRFTEKDGLRGKKIVARKLLSEKLF
jgi:2,3-bisphosphoglycerate-independent phosphoglycerate mutase